MVNHLSRCLLSMAAFAAVSSLTGWQVVSYALFATGICAIILSHCSENRRMRTGAGMCVALPGMGLLGGAHPALLLIMPVAFASVVVTANIKRNRARPSCHDDRGAKENDDPLTNLCVSLPSAVALLAFLAIA